MRLISGYRTWQSWLAWYGQRGSMGRCHGCAALDGRCGDPVMRYDGHVLSLLPNRPSRRQVARLNEATRSQLAA